MRFMHCIRPSMSVHDSNTSSCIEPIGEEDRTWIAEQLAIVDRLVLCHSPADRGLELSPAVLDRVYAGWWKSPTRYDGDPNEIVDAAGSAFGQYLVEQRGLSWVITTDELGSDLAIHDKSGRFFVYPACLIANRYERGETRFLETFNQSISQTAWSLSNATTVHQGPNLRIRSAR